MAPVSPPLGALLGADAMADRVGLVIEGREVLSAERKLTKGAKAAFVKLQGWQAVVNRPVERVARRACTSGPIARVPRQARMHRITRTEQMCCKSCHMTRQTAGIAPSIAIEIRSTKAGTQGAGLDVS